MQSPKSELGELEAALPALEKPINEARSHVDIEGMQAINATVRLIERRIAAERGAVRLPVGDERLRERE